MASQFRARPQDLPEFASDPWGKVFFQFKAFAYQQTRMVKQPILNEIRDKHYGRGLRNLALLTLLFPLAGKGVRWLRGLLTGRKRRGLARYLDDAAAVGSMGILWDMIEGGRRRKLIETAAGPSARAARLTSSGGRAQSRKTSDQRDAHRSQSRSLHTGAIYRIQVFVSSNDFLAGTETLTDQ